MIYTDLFDNGKNEQKVLCKRHADSYFLSSAECIFSAEAQLEHPTPCKYSKTGYFGSRFITCVVSGKFNKKFKKKKKIIIIMYIIYYLFVYFILKKY